MRGVGQCLLAHEHSNVSLLKEQGVHSLSHLVDSDAALVCELNQCGERQGLVLGLWSSASL